MRTLALLFVFFSPLLLAAQKNFQSGYIVNRKGDTITGMIDYRDWSYSPTSILFKPSGNDDAKEYTVNELDFFTINGAEAFRRSIVKISVHPARLNEIGVRDTSWKMDTVFLKVLHIGKTVSLFSYEDRIKERFYILEEQQEQPAELAFREYFREGTASLVTENSYRNQLKNVLHTRGLYTDNLGERIDDATYDERELKRIITRMNKSGNEEYVEEKRSSSTNWFAGIGLQNNNMHFEGDHHLARREIDNNSPWLPKISAGIDLYANPAVGKIFYRLELAYQVNKSTIVASIDNDTKAVYEFSGSSISLQPQIHYVIYNSPKLKIPLAVGAGYGHASYSKNLYKKVYTSGEENDHHQNWLNLKKSITSLFVKGSVIVNRKIETAFRYELPQRPAGNARYSLMTQNIQVQVYYLFGKKS